MRKQKSGKPVKALQDVSRQNSRQNSDGCNDAAGEAEGSHPWVNPTRPQCADLAAFQENNFCLEVGGAQGMSQLVPRPAAVSSPVLTSPSAWQWRRRTLWSARLTPC